MNTKTTQNTKLLIALLQYSIYPHGSIITPPAEVVNALLKSELLRYDGFKNGVAKYLLTDRGEAYVTALKAVSLPLVTL